MDALIAAAQHVRERAYAPYSHFSVGAALEGVSGQIYVGCNVENAAFPAGICAERAALVAAIAAGERSFTRLAIVAEGTQLISPCGMCRQALMEFSPEMMVVMANLAGATRSSKLADLLPMAFHL